MNELQAKIVFIIFMVICVSWIVGVVSDSKMVGVVAGACCVAYICYQSAKEDDE